nr:reverse transcriptase domain-containing protein [Tanacetum cinerariifolium]
MSSSNYPFIVPSDFDIEDAFSSTNTPDYTLASPDYFPALPRNNPHDSSNDLTKDLLASLAFSPFHDDPYMKVIQAYNATNELSLDHIEEMQGHVDDQVIIQQDFDKLKTELQEARAQIARLQRKKMRHNNKIALARFRISTLELIIKNIQNFVLSYVDRMPPKRTSTSAAPTMTQAAIKKLVADSVATALETQAATMANTKNTNRNTGPKETPIARKGNYKEFIIYQPLYFIGTNDHKRKFDDRRNTTTNNYSNNRINNYQNNHNNNSNRNNDYHQQQNRRQETFRAYAATLTENSRYTGSFPLCEKCTVHHTGPYTVKCHTCNKVGHLTRNCKNKGPATGSNLQPVSVTFHAYEEKGHYTYQCSKANNNAQERIYLLRDKNAHRDSNVVMGTFLLYQHLARVLFDSGADKSFVSISLSYMLNIPPITLDTIYDVEIANGNRVGTNTVIQAQVMEKKSDEKRLEDIPVVREFMEVFLEDLPGLPSIPQVEFQIDLIPGATPLARAPYILAPLEMQELSNQLQELAN